MISIKKHWCFKKCNRFSHSDSFCKNVWVTDITGLNTLNFDLLFNSVSIGRANVFLNNVFFLPWHRAAVPVEVWCYFKENVQSCGDPTSQEYLWFSHLIKWNTRLKIIKWRMKRTIKGRKSCIFTAGNIKLYGKSHS